MDKLRLLRQEALRVNRAKLLERRIELGTLAEQRIGGC
jgi:hypothetical protein